jgi:hypothetical protein
MKWAARINQEADDRKRRDAGEPVRQAGGNHPQINQPAEHGTRDAQRDEIQHPDGNT